MNRICDGHRQTDSYLLRVLILTLHFSHRLYRNSDCHPTDRQRQQWRYSLTCPCILVYQEHMSRQKHIHLLRTIRYVVCNSKMIYLGRETNVSIHFVVLVKELETAMNDHNATQLVQFHGLWLHRLSFPSKESLQVVNHLHESISVAGQKVSGQAELLVQTCM